MPAAEARIATTRATRYLAQLCDHLGRMRHGRLAARRHRSGGPPVVQHVEHDGDHAVIVFDWGQCTLDATPDALVVRAEASDEPGLARGQTLIARRVETIGRREHLIVTWQPQPAG